MSLNSVHSSQKIASEGDNPLKVLRAFVQDDMEKVNALIYSQVENEISLIPDISGHTVDSGGKRLRPMLTLACAKLCGYEEEHHITLATTVEFMHTATLLHDDVVDGSELRRSRKTANNIWGNKASILVGDYLLGKAFNLMVKPQSLRILEILSHAAMVISEGEVLQLSCEGTLPDDDKNYYKIIDAKTAALFSAACEVGAVVAGADVKESDALRDYGRYLGLAFQIADDALDYAASQEALGKRIGDDFRDRKATLPLIMAYQKADAQQKAFWERTIVDDNQTEEDCQQAVAYIHQHQAIEASLAEAHKLASKAVESLAVFKDSELKSSLAAVATYSVERSV